MKDCGYAGGFFWEDEGGFTIDEEARNEIENWFRGISTEYTYHDSGRKYLEEVSSGVTREYEDLEIYDDGNGRLIKEIYSIGAYKLYEYYVLTPNIKTIDFFMPDSILYMKEEYGETGTLDTVSTYYSNGQIKDLRNSDGTWSKYAEDGTLIESGIQTEGIEVVYDAAGIIKELISGIYLETREYIRCGDEIVYTIARHDEIIKAVKEGYYEGTEIISQAEPIDSNDTVSVTYDNNITVNYAGEDITSLSVKGGYVNFYTDAGDVLYQNSSRGDLYCFDSGFLEQVVTIGGNVYDFTKTSDLSGITVSLTGALIDGVKYSFLNSRLIAINEDSDSQIDITHLELKNNLKISSLTVTRAGVEETLTEENEIFKQIENLLKILNDDVPNIKFNYTTELDIEEILTSGYSRLHFENGRISKTISTENVEVGYEYIEEGGEITGLKMIEDGAVRIFDNLGKLLSVELVDEKTGEISKLIFDGEDLLGLEADGSILENIKFDAEDNIESVKLTDAEGSEYFFIGGKLKDFIDNQNVKYEADDDGKIISLNRLDTGESFEIVYSIDVNDDKELTTFTSNQDGVQYVFKDDLMTSLTDPAGVQVNYMYDNSERTKQIDVFYGGQKTSTFVYEYQDDGSVVITDDIGVKRTYDENKKAVKVETPYGETYSYVYDTNIDGEPITIVNYTQKDCGDGTSIQYFQGQIKRITRPDGSYIDNVEFDQATQKLKKFSLHTADEKHRNVSIDGKFIQFEMEDSTRLIFCENTLVAFANSQGIVPLYDIEDMEELKNIIYARNRDESGASPGQEDVNVAASSWRHQTYADSQAIRFVETDYQNDQWIVNLDLCTKDSKTSQGEMFLDLRYDIPGLAWQAPIDMTGKEISFLIKLDENFEHDPNYQCNIQVFAKDNNWNTQYGTKVKMTESGDWLEAAYIPTEEKINSGYTNTGFDASNIVMIGLRISEPDYAPADISYLGKVYVKHSIMPDLFENVNYETSPLDELYDSLGLIRDLGRLYGDPTETDAEAYLESFVDTLSNGAGDMFQENLVNYISWHPEEEAAGIKGIESAYRDTATSEMVLNVNLNSVSYPNKEGEIFFDIRTDIPGLNWNEPINLTTRPIRMQIEVPEEFIGNVESPNGARIFVEDIDKKMQYGTWINLKEGGKWYQLELAPTYGEVPMGFTQEGFDPSKIVRIGINLATQPNSNTNFQGKLRLKFLDRQNNDDSGTIINTPLWMDLRNVRDYLLDENDNYIRLPKLNYISESHLNYIFNRGSGEIPTANFEAIEKTNTCWMAQEVTYNGKAGQKALTNVWWENNYLKTGLDFNSSQQVGEILLDLRYSCYVPEKNWQNEMPLDMTMQEIVFYIRAEEGMVIDAVNPLQVEAFVKDSPNWKAEYSKKIEFTACDSNWTKIVLRPAPVDFKEGYASPGFDPTKIIALGLRVKSRSSSDTYTGALETKYEINNISEGVCSLCEAEILPTNPIWVNQRDLGKFLSDNEIALYGDYKVMEEINQLIGEIPTCALPMDFAATTIYDENEKVVSISKPDGTTTHFNENNQIDYIAFEDGSKFVDYEYNGEKELIEATMESARENLNSAYNELIFELNKKTVDALLLLAEQNKLLEEDFLNNVNENRAIFSQERKRLENLRYMEIEHNFLWWSWTERVERPGVTEAIFEVNRQEAEFNAQVANDLARLDETIAEKQEEISEEKESIIEKYKLEEKKLLLGIIREETIPIVFYCYRRTLGRDAREEEIKSILLRIDSNNDFAGFFTDEINNYEALIEAVRQDEANPIYQALKETIQETSEITESAKRLITRDLDTLINDTQLYTKLSIHFGSEEALKGKLSDKTKLYIQSHEQPDAWTNRYILQDLYSEITKKETGLDVFNAAVLRSELETSQEKQKAETFKETVIANIKTFIENLSAAPENLSQLNLTQNEIIEVTDAYKTALYDWLEENDLHFGRSAFGALKKLLDDNNMVISEEDLAKECILIDVLTGITGPLTDEILEISMYTMDKVAQLHGLTLETARLTYEDIKAAQKPFITLINGHHYVTVFEVTDTSVTYWDESVGENGQEIETSRKDFERNWNGNSIVNDTTISAEKKLTESETKHIKGAFFFAVLFGTLIAGIANAIAGLATIAIGTITAAVMGLATIVGQLALGLVQAIANVGSILAFGMGKFLGALGIGAVAGAATAGGATAAGTAATGFSLSALASGIGTTLVNVSVGYGVSIGLEALGVDPVVSGLISSVVTGGVAGFMSGGIGAVFKTALQYGASYGMNLLGQHLDLDPTITSILSMTTTALIGAGLDPNITLKQAVDTIAKNVVSELAYYGVQTAGTALGIDPNISYLAGIAIRSSLRAGFSDGQDPGAWLDGAIEGFEQGVTSLAINYVTEKLELDPLTANAIMLAVGGAIDGVQDGDILKGITDAYKNALLNATSFGVARLDSETGQIQIAQGSSWQEAAYISRVLDITNSLKENGLEQTLYDYSASVLHCEAVNGFTRPGGVYDILGEHLSEIGDVAFEIINKLNGTKEIKNTETGETIGKFKQEKGEHFLESGEYEDDPVTGEAQLVNGREIMTNGEQVVTIEIEEGEHTNITILDKQTGDVTKIKSIGENGINEDNYQLTIVPAEGNSVYTYSVENSIRSDVNGASHELPKYEPFENIVAYNDGVTFYTGDDAPNYVEYNGDIYDFRLEKGEIKVGSDGNMYFEPHYDPSQASGIEIGIYLAVKTLFFNNPWLKQMPPFLPEFLPKPRQKAPIPLA